MGSSDGDAAVPGGVRPFLASALAGLGPHVIHDERDAPRPEGNELWGRQTVVSIPVTAEASKRYLSLVVTHRGFPRGTRSAIGDTLTWSLTGAGASLGGTVNASDLHHIWLSSMAGGRTLGGARPFWVIPLGFVADGEATAGVTVTTASARGEWLVAAVLTEDSQALAGVGGRFVAPGAGVPENHVRINDRPAAIPFGSRPQISGDSTPPGSAAGFDSDGDFSPELEEQAAGTDPGDSRSAPVVLSSQYLARTGCRWRPNGYGGWATLVVNDGWAVFDPSTQHALGVPVLGLTYPRSLVPGTQYEGGVFFEAEYRGEPRGHAADFVGLWEKQGDPTVQHGLPADTLGMDAAWAWYMPEPRRRVSGTEDPIWPEYISSVGKRYRLRGPLNDTPQSRTFLRVRWEKTWPNYESYMSHVRKFGFGWWEATGPNMAALGDPVSVTTETLIIPKGAYYSEPMDIVPILPAGQFSDGITRVVLERLVSVDLEIAPSGQQVVSADDAAAGIDLQISSDADDLLAGDVKWTLLPGSHADGAVDKATSILTTDEEPSDVSVLSTGRVSGQRYLVEGKLEGVYFGLPDDPIDPGERRAASIPTAKAEFIVGPGQAKVIDHEIIEAFGPESGTTVMPDGKSTRRIRAVIRDAYGNLVAKGTPVAWKVLEGDGEISEVQDSTNSAGEVTALFKAGRIGGLRSSVAIQCDDKSKLVVFDHSPYTADSFTLNAGDLQVAGSSYIVNVVAEVSAADGAKVLWQTTRGVIVGEATVLNGTASATVTIQGGDLGHTMVVTAAVGRTNCLLSKVLVAPGVPGAPSALGFVLTAPGHPNTAYTVSFANGQLPGVSVHLASNPSASIPMPSAVTTDDRGLVIGQLIFAAGDYTYEQLRLVLKDSAGQVVAWSACHLLPTVGVTGSVISLVNSLSARALKAGSISSELHTQASYVAIPPGEIPAPVAAELSREALEDARQLLDPASETNPPPVGETPQPADLAPPALGGNLEQQAQQAVSLVSLTAAIDNICADAVELSKKLNAVEIKDEMGAKIGTVALGYSMFDGLKLAWPEGVQMLEEGAQVLEEVYNQTKKAFVVGLVSASAESLVAAAKAAKAFNNWEALEVMGEKMGVLPFIQDAKVFVDTLSEEGFINFITAMEKFARSFADDPTAVALASIQHADPWLKSKINGWAMGDDERKHVIAAFAGLCSQMLQNGAMLAASLADAATALKRALGNVFATIISASMGSQEAQDQLWEMVPGYSWLLMGGQIQVQWQISDYYEAGKQAWNLIIQVVGDVTIFIPFVKGGSAALKMMGQQMEVSLKQGLKKVDDGFVRAASADLSDIPDGRLAKQIRECADGLCFPAGTLVLMADGSRKAIQNIRPGEQVLADDPEDDLPPAARTVLGVRENWTEYLTRIGLDGDGDGDVDATIQATNRHPFWTEQSGWVAANELQLGDILRDRKGNEIVVESLEEVSRVCRTWNITVREWHTYFVEQDGVSILTHNLKPGPRDYTVYTLEWKDPVSGVKKAYTGYATLPAGDSKEVWSFEDIMDRRYPGKRYVIRVDDPLRPGKSMKLVLPADTEVIMRHPPFRHNNLMDGVDVMLDSRGKKAKQPGNIIVEGMERLQFAEDMEKYGANNMMNRQRFKRSDSRSQMKEAAAQMFMGGQPGCSRN
jgi:hypothetical protein